MKKAIIVGATSGIGKELAIQLVNKNYLVGVTGRREDLLAELKNKYPDNIFYKCFDVSKDNNSDKLDELTAKLGSLDLLIISSGTGEFNPELIFEIEKNTLDVNINGFVEIACWGFNYFKKQGYGHLAGITSISGLRGSREGLSYSATKSFQIKYLEGLRQNSQHNKLSITVTDIRPGFVDTKMAKADIKFWVASPAKAAKQILTSIKRKKDIAYITRRWSIIAFLIRIIPDFIYKQL